MMRFAVSWWVACPRIWGGAWVGRITNVRRPGRYGPVVEPGRGWRCRRGNVRQRGEPPAVRWVGRCGGAGHKIITAAPGGRGRSPAVDRVRSRKPPSAGGSVDVAAPLGAASSGRAGVTASDSPPAGAHPATRAGRHVPFGGKWIATERARSAIPAVHDGDADAMSRQVVPESTVAPRPPVGAVSGRTADDGGGAHPGRHRRHRRCLIGRSGNRPIRVHGVRHCSGMARVRQVAAVTGSW